MQHIITEIKDNFQDFIADEEKTVMVVAASAEESLLLLKTLSMLEDDELSPDVFLSHTDGFADTRSYVAALHENQAIQIEAVNEELAARKEPLLAELPPELSVRTMTNHDRLAGIAAHARLITQPERKIIWVFFPLEEVAPEEAYANLLRHLIFEVFDGRIEHTKIIVRDTTAQAVRAKVADRERDTYFYEPKLDLDSIFEKIEAQAENPHAPPDERAQNMMLMAGVDVAEKRFDAALDRNGAVLKYFEKSDQKQKQSVVHNNIGDIYYLQGDFPQAQKSYENAVSIAIDEKSQPLVIYQSINLGNALFMQGKYDEALIYYQSAEKLAAMNKAIVQQIQAMERAGDTQKAQDKIAEAIETWEKAADVCRENGYKIGLVGVLERLDAVYEERSEAEKRRPIRRELEAARTEIKAIEPALLEK